MKDIDILKELRQLNFCVRRHMDRSPAKKELDSTGGTHGWIICYIADHADRDIFQRDLEREFGITRSTTSKMIGLMEKNGLVKREKVVHDDRLKKIVLTDKSKKLAEKLHKDKIQTEKQLTTGFTQEELRTLSGYLQRMKDNITR